MSSLSDSEFLTVEQFADRLQVSRATVFAWMQKKILIQGQHFLRLGRVVRFVWSASLLDALLLLSLEQEGVQVSPRPIPVRASASRRRNKGINWEY